MERELTPQEAAAVWMQVPAAESALTSKVAGLSNLLTGFGLLLIGAWFIVGHQGSQWTGHAVFGNYTALLAPAGALGAFALFFWLRSALWKVYGLARPGSNIGSAYDRGDRPGYRIWYILATVWIVALALSGNVVQLPEPILATGSLGLLVIVYSLTMGHWESQHDWSRRPYLLWTSIPCAVGVVAWKLLGHPWPFADFAIMGLAWIVAGFLLYRQA